MNDVPRETTTDASRASDPFEHVARLQMRAVDRLAFTLPPEPVSAEEMAEHDKRVGAPDVGVVFGPCGETYVIPINSRPGGITIVPTDDPAPTWLTARPVIFALGTACGGLFVLLMRGWA